MLGENETPTCTVYVMHTLTTGLVSGRCACVGDGRGAGGREGRDRLPPLPHHR
jgi:hypothetical protein